MNIFCLFNYPFVFKLSDWQHSYTLDSLAHHWTQQHMKHHFYAHVSAIIVTETRVHNKLCELCRSKIAFITNKITKVQYCFWLCFLQACTHTNTPKWCIKSGVYFNFGCISFSNIHSVNFHTCSKQTCHSQHWPWSTFFYLPLLHPTPYFGIAWLLWSCRLDIAPFSFSMWPKQ